MKISIFFFLALSLMISCSRVIYRNTLFEHSIKTFKVIKKGLPSRKKRTARYGNKKIINVLFLNGSKVLQKTVDEVASEWQDFGNFNFIFYTKRSLPQRIAPDIRVRFHRGRSSDSYVGRKGHRINKNLPTMNLGIIGDSYISQRETVLHEFGHALGLNHAHQHPQRSFSFNKNKLYAHCWDRFNYSKKQCNWNILKKNPIKNYLSYDEDSIMHYSFPAKVFSGWHGKHPNNSSLSLGDKLLIAKLYPGRMGEDEIRQDHQGKMNWVAKAKELGNCRVRGSVDTDGTQMYSYKSITKDDFDHRYVYSSKEAVLHGMFKEKYCHLNSHELATYQRNLKRERKQKSVYGYCRVPLLGESVSYHVGCDNPKYPYHVGSIKRDRVVVSQCYQNFEQALSVMKKSYQCRNGLAYN